MIRQQLLILTLAVCFAAPLSACASTWYVDNAATGTNAGTSWQDAWTSFSVISWSKIKPDDKIYISGGRQSKVYTERWGVGASGLAGHPITITVDVANADHNGRVIFDYDTLGDNCPYGGAINISGRSYLVFDGNVNGGNHIVIRNIRNILQATAALGIYGWGNGAGDPMRNVVVDHLDFENVNGGVRVFNGISNFEIKDSRFLKIRGDAAIALLGSTATTWDQNLIHGNDIELLFNSTKPSGSYSYAGPDGIQSGSGLSVYRNVIKISRTNLYTSTQHPDMVQMTGNYVKVYDNEFINVGDSIIDYDTYSNANPHDIWIYNNIFRTTETIDVYPEYIRMYCTGPAWSSLTNLKVFNNLFVDSGLHYTAIRFSYTSPMDPLFTGVEFRNNIFDNLSVSSSPVAISVPANTSITNNSNAFIFNRNVYYAPGGNVPYISFNNKTYTANDWVLKNDLNGKVIDPQFQRYSAYAQDNDYHLAAFSSLIGQGEDLSSVFLMDKDGYLRPSGSWDIGPYQHHPQYCVTPEGAGVKTGIDWNNALAGLPAKLLRGATYYLSGGNYASYVFDTPVSGEQLITIKKATAQDHGAASGWDDAYASQAVFTGSGRAWRILTGNLTIDGVSGMSTSGYGIKLVGTEPGNWNEGVIDIPHYDADATVNNLIIRHVEIQGSGVNKGISGICSNLWLTSSGWTLERIYIHDVYEWVALSGVNDVTLDHNYLQNAGSTPQDGVSHHCAGITSGGQHIIISHNVFENMFGRSNAAYIEPQGSNGADVNIFGNVFWASSPDELTTQWAVSMTSSDTINGLYVYNNTFYGLHSYSIGISGGNVTGSTNVVVRNNIFQNCSQPVTFKNVTQQDHNILNTGEVVFRDTVHGDFRLAAPTSKGLALSDPFDQDVNDASRGVDGAWDIGAYEFSANLPGDVSGDGRVTMLDAALVLKYTVGGALTAAQQAQADMNGDAKVDAADAMAIARKALGI